MRTIIAKLLAYRVYRFRDSAAYERLYDEYHSQIRRAIARKIGKAEDVDELTAETFLRAWEYMTANMVENPRAFLYKVAKNLVAYFYRQPTHSESLSDDVVENTPSRTSLAKEIEVREEVDEVLAAINALREEYRDVLLMRFVEQQSVEEIAQALDKTPNNVRVLLFRAKRALGKHL